MSGFVEWLGAQADPGDAGRREITGVKRVAQRATQPQGKEALKVFQGADGWQNLPTHNYPREVSEADAAQQYDDLIGRNPDLWLYRRRSVGLLRRYMRFSLETGRLPSLMGRDFFRAKLTCYRAVTFEDRVIFVRDMERCLDRLTRWDQQLIARVILQEHSHEDAARILHCCRRTVQRRVPEVLDLLSEDFLRVGLLAALPAKKSETV